MRACSVLGLRQQQGELLAAVAGREVPLPQHGAQQEAEVAQQPVAGQVAVLVVERLEVVEVAQDQRVAVAGAVRDADRDRGDWPAR